MGYRADDNADADSDGRTIVDRTSGKLERGRDKAAARGVPLRPLIPMPSTTAEGRWDSCSGSDVRYSVGRSRNMDVTLRCYLLTPLFVVLASGMAAGQDRSQRVEVFAGAGVSRVGGDEGSLGHGACLVAGFGFRFAARASVEVD